MADPKPTRLTGIVAHLFLGTGGLIVTSDQTVYCYHGRQVLGKFPPKHAVVSFESAPPSPGRTRPRAVNVKIEAMPGQQ